MSKLKLKEVQQKQLVGPPPGTNGEFNSSYLTLDESNDIMKETIGQFTLQSTSVYSENKSLDLSIVTEVYNVQFDFNYSLLGDENTIASVKELVSKSMTVTEYAGDITGSKILDKVSSKGGIASGILNEDYISLFETATTTISEKLLANKNSVLTAIFKKGAPAIAEKSVGVISLALTNSAAESNTDKKDEAVKNLKTRTVAALLLFFETGNKTKTVISPAQDPNPSRSDNTHIPLVNPNQ